MRRQYPHRPHLTVATHFPSLSAARDLNPNVHMFTEDVRLAIMPIGGRSEKQKNFAVALDGDKNASERARDLMRDLAESDRDDLPRLVCGAVEGIGKRLAWEGCAIYEIIRSDDSAHHIYGFTAKRLVRIPGWFVQIIPRADWELWKMKWAAVPVSRIWHVEMPEILQGRSGYLRTLRKLRRFQQLGPAFWRKDLEQGEQSKHFDFQRYVRNTEIYSSQVTNVWGWNRRDRSQERTTEFYGFYKMVTFHWAQAVLREHIILELNALFSRLDVNCQLKINGLPTASEILKIRQELLGGTISFKSASERVSL